MFDKCVLASTQEQMEQPIVHPRLRDDDREMHVLAFLDRFFKGIFLICYPQLTCPRFSFVCMHPTSIKLFLNTHLFCMAIVTS